MPEAWRDRYQPFENAEWEGWVETSLATSGAKYLENPAGAFEEGALRWFKQGRNRLAEVRWPRPRGVAGVSDEEETGESIAETVVLKEYRSIGLTGAVRSALRPPRAVGGWQKAFVLMGRGFSTPRPLWLALSKRGGPCARAYLAVETAPPHIRLREILKQIAAGARDLRIGNNLRIETNLFLSILAGYVRSLHDAGIWHRDFSGGNLLISEDWRPARPRAGSAPEPFILIDINRARIFPPGALSLPRRLQDLERISLPEELRPAFYAAYAAGNPDLLRADGTYLLWARRYRRLREDRNPVTRLCRKIVTYWLRLP